MRKSELKSALNSSAVGRFAESSDYATGKNPGWGVLHHQAFKALWIAAVASNLGTWMHEVGAAWLMTSLSSSPLMVSLIQTAATLPVFLIALAAGALADVVDRRRLLLVTQGWMLAAACLLGILTVLSLTTPWALLGLTFMLYAGSALNGPAWQAIVPELVPREEVPAAVALNSVGFNVARAAGPALGGLIVASAGPSAVFFLNSASFVAVITVLFRWQRPARESTLPAERVWGAVRAGVRYARYAPLLQRVLVRAFLFTFFASAIWALMPVVAKVTLGRGAASYGLLLGSMGAGAVLGGSVLPRTQRAFSTGKLLGATLVLYAFGLFLLGFSHRLALSCLATALAGIAWTSLLSTLNAIVQVEASVWVRGRALAVYQLCVFGGWAVGSVIWGAAATHSSIPDALFIASVGMAASLAVVRRFPLKLGTGAQYGPGAPWLAPVVVSEPDPDEGPVLVMVEYQIDPGQAEEFSRAMHELGRIRRRTGAMSWGLFHDVAEPGRYVETFTVESWMEHLRQHERPTLDDRAVEKRILAFQREGAAPKVSHLIAARSHWNLRKDNES